LRRELPVSERRICRVLGQHRSTHRKVPRGSDDELRLTDDIIALATQYRRYGYRRVAALLATCLLQAHAPSIAGLHAPYHPCGTNRRLRIAASLPSGRLRHLPA
jgi:hypothetical protein